MYGSSYTFRHYIAVFREAFLVSSERCSIEEQSIVIRHNTSIHNIRSTAPQLNISQKPLGTLPDDGNVMPKNAGAK
jgi:hypothetical protein